jgi:hypothetical protein
MAKIVEIKVLPLVDDDHIPTGKKAPIMFLDCGHGYVHIGNQEVGDSIFCTKCAKGE